MLTRPQFFDPRPLPSRTPRWLTRALALARFWGCVALCAAAAALLVLGGWAGAQWLWSAVHPALAVALMLVAMANALFAAAMAVVLVSEDGEDR